VEFVTPLTGLPGKMLKTHQTSAVSLVVVACVTAVVTRFQHQFPLITVESWVVAAPFALGGLFAILVGWRAIPVVVAVTVVVGMLARLPVEALIVGAFITASQGGVGLAARRLVPTWGSIPSRDVMRGVGLILLSVVVRGILTAGVGVAIGAADPYSVALAAAVGDWFTGLLFVPLVFAWTSPPVISHIRRYLELAGILFLTTLFSQLLFGGSYPLAVGSPLLMLGGYALLFGWASFRFYLHGSTAVAAVAFLVVVTNTTIRGGFDPVLPQTASLGIQMQLLVVAGLLVALQHFAAAVAGDRSGTAAEVVRLHDELSARHTDFESQSRVAAQDHAFLEAVLNQLPVGVMIVGPDGGILERNARYRQMFPSDSVARLQDLPQGQISVTGFHQVPFDRWPIVKAIQHGESTEGFAARMKLNSGAEIDVNIYACPVKGPSGELLGAVSVLSDVSERKTVERQLRESEQKLRIALQSARMMVVEWETATGRFRTPTALIDWFRLHPTAPVNCVTDLLPYIDREDAEGLAEKVRWLMNGNPRCETLFRIHDAHQQVMWVLSRSMALTDETGQPTGWVSSVLVDVTERYRQMDELRLLESAVVHARDAVIILEDKPQAGGGRSVLYANRAFTEMSGYEPHEVIGRSLHFLRGPNSDPVTLDRLRDALDERRAFQCELLNYRKNGTEFWVELSVVPVPDPSGNCTHWVMIQRDVSDRKRADAELRSSREMLAEAQRIAHIGSWEYDPVTRESNWSDEEYRIFGVDPAVGRMNYDRFVERVHVDDRAKTVEQMMQMLSPTSDSKYSLDFRIVRPSGEVRHVHDECVADRGPDGQVIRLRGVTQDVTERRQAQEHLIQAQKMELIGQMAGGIAHDFNNVLTGVIGNLDMVALSKDDPNRRLIDTATRAAFRATDMTKKLLGFARKSQLRLAPVSLATIVTEVLEFIGRTTDPRIELLPMVKTSARVEGDFTLLSQVLLNLCLNARDAMPHGGRIEIRVSEENFPPDRPHSNGRTGDFLRLTVEDNGTGMSPEILARVFEPFFTTKPVGEGTGLGLAMVHGIVEQHRGWVECQSEVGRGTRFDLYLPRVVEPTEPSSGFTDRSAPLHQTPPPAAVSANQKTVLLVDDEELIRELARTVLQVNGYRVLEANDGEQALDLFRDRWMEIDLVVLDLTMPRLSGQDTFRAMQGINPAARVLFSSGYSAETLADTGGVIGMLPKPYRPADLVAAVGAALSGSYATAS
jgi:PAS domain S-box-containing protein